jgi:predicted TPR repeat methyltransferase
LAKVFNAFAKYYDLLYKEKDYTVEVDYIEKIIKNSRRDAKRILNIGSGTGGMI